MGQKGHVKEAGGSAYGRGRGRGHGHIQIKGRIFNITCI